MSYEKDLIKKLKSPDWETQNRYFRTFYDLYFKDLYRFVWQYVKSSETAQEITHDAFVRLWLHRGSLDENRSVRSYLFTICRNSLLKELRRQLRNPLLRDYLEFSGHLSSDARISYDYDVFIRTVEEAKTFLSPRQREIYTMNKETGLTVKEIARQLGIGEQVVRNQLSTAVRKVRDHIAKMHKEQNGML